MKLTIKDYKIAKTKEYFKANNLFFFVNGINQSSLNWLTSEQELKTIGFIYYKVLNKTTVKTLNSSTYRNISPAIMSSTFLIRPSQTKPFLKQTISNTFNPLFFELLIIKFNNRIYSANFLKSIYSLNYKEIKLFLYQFNLIPLKTFCQFSK